LLSGERSAFVIELEGPGTADGSIDTPADVLLRNAGGRLELVEGSRAIATAPAPFGSVLGASELRPVPTEGGPAKGWTHGDMLFSYAATFGAGSEVSIKRTSTAAPGGLDPLFDNYFVDEQPWSVQFMANNVVLAYFGSVNGEFVDPLVIIFGDESTVRLACAVGARIPAEFVRQLGLSEVGPPRSCR
jgi:hypothetical protein